MTDNEDNEINEALCTEDAVEEFTVITNNNTYEKKPLVKIIEESKSVDCKKIALEVIGWAIENVENYIDNTVKIFKLDLVLDAEETMQETKKIQDLYRAIPNDEDLIDPDIVTKLKEAEKNGQPLEMDEETEKIMDSIQDCRKVLDEIVKKAHEEINSLNEYMDKLSERLVYYYEMKGVKDGVPLIQDLNGSADIIKFEYESFNVGVRVREAVVEKETSEGEIIEEGGSVVSEYIVPEGFTLWIEIALKDKRPPSLF